MSTVATRTISTDIRPVSLAGRIRERPWTIAVIGLAVLGVLIVAGVTMGSYYEWMRSCTRITMTAHPAMSIPARSY